MNLGKLDNVLVESKRVEDDEDKMIINDDSLSSLGNSLISESEQSEHTSYQGPKVPGVQSRHNSMTTSYE